MLDKLLGGTFGYFQAATIGVVSIALVWVWQDYKGAKKDVTRLTEEKAALKSVVASKDSVIASMGRTAGRRDAQDTQSKDLANDILKAKDGTACAQSDPINIVLNGLRHGAARGTVNVTDKAFSMPARTHSASNK